MRTPILSSVAVPAAGADFTLPLPAEEKCRVLAVFAQLTTSATVANRIPALRMLATSGLEVGRLGVNSNIAASALASITWGINLATITGGAVLAVALTDCWLPVGSSLVSLTVNIQSTDQWSNISYLYEVDRDIEDDSQLSRGQFNALQSMSM